MPTGKLSDRLVFDRKRRAALFTLGVMVAGLGVALSTQAGLGATSISSVPWVLTGVVPLSYGTLTLIFKLSHVKIAFDAGLTLAAILLSLGFLGRIEGVREGTVLSVFLVGTFVGFFLSRLRGLRKWCYHWSVV